MKILKNIKLLLAFLLFSLFMSNYSFAQTPSSQVQTSSEESISENAISKHFWEGQEEMSDDYKIEIYKDIGCWECVLISNFFDSVGSVFIFLYEKLTFALRPLLFLLFMFWLIDEYRKKAMSGGTTGRGFFLDNKGSVQELIKMFVKVTIAMVFLSIPSTLLFKYTVSPMINFASSLGSVTLNKMDEEIFLNEDTKNYKYLDEKKGKYLNLNTERQKARQQEVHDLIHRDVLRSERIDSNVSPETNTLIPEGAKKEILYLTERFSETYSYGFKLGFKIGVAGGTAFLRNEAINLLLKEVVLKKVIPTIGGPLAPIISFIVKGIVIVYDKARAALKFVYMKIIAFGWFILGLYFMMSFKFLFVMLNTVMEFSIAALLTPFAIITYPFKGGTLGIGDFQDNIRDRFFSSSCYLFMVCIISSFIYFIFSHFLQTPYMYKGEVSTLKEIFDHMLYGGFVTSTWGYVSSFMMFFWNNMDIMYIMAGIGIIGMKLIEQTASLTGTFLTPVKTEYEGKFLDFTFGAASKIFKATKTSVKKASKSYGDAKKKFEKDEKIKNVGNIAQAFDTQKKINKKQLELESKIESSSDEIKPIIDELEKKDSNNNSNKDSSEEISEGDFIDNSIDTIEGNKKEELSDAMLNDNRVKDFSDSQSLVLKSMIATGDINKSNGLYSSEEEISSDIHLQDEIKDKYINEQKVKNPQKSSNELEIEYNKKKNSPDNSFSKEISKIKSSVVKERKENVKKVFAEHKALDLVKDDGFKDVLKDTSLGKKASLESEDWVKEKAVDIIRVVRSTDRAKEYLSPDFSDEKKSMLRKEFKEIFDLKKELKELKSDENYNSQREFLGVDEINNKVVLEHIYKVQDAILERAQDKYGESIKEFGLDGLSEKEKKEIEQLKLLVEATKRKQKKKNKDLDVEEFSILESEDGDIYSEENIAQEEEKIIDMFKKFNMNEEYSFYKNQRKKADRKNKDNRSDAETSEDYDEL